MADSATGTWVCIECGGRQEAAGTCAACGRDDVLDARKDDVRELMADIDLRLADKREALLRWCGVLLAVAIVVAGWLTPGYWKIRGVYYPGLPFLADQFAFMIAIAIGLMAGGKRLFGHRPRFPYLDIQQQLR